MRIGVILLVVISLLSFCGCGGTYEAYDFESGGSSTETIGVKWQGEFSHSPVLPDTNWVYYNNSDSVVYLYTGTTWDTLAVRSAGDVVNMEGLDSVKLAWRGVLSEAPEDPKLYWAYRNRTLKTSFIWDSTAWAVLIKDSDSNSSLIWKGALSTPPVNPQKNWAYFNTTTGKSYKFDGTSWIVLDSENVKDGDNLNRVKWLGDHSSAPSNVTEFSLYYNSTDSNTYIYTNLTFRLFTFYDVDADYSALDGRSISWHGTLDESPGEPEENAIYCDFRTKSTLFWNGTEWAVLFASHHYPYNWRGVLDEAPENPSGNWAYFNTSTNKSYKYQGGAWVSLNKDNIADATITTKPKWLGIYSTEPVNPNKYDIYINKVNANSYIYNDTGFQLFAFYDVNADYIALEEVSISWLGALDMLPSDPQLHDVFYHSDRRCTFIWNGTDWAVLSGYLNFPYNWRGIFAQEPDTPQKDWAYYNTVAKKSYYYTGTYWNSFSHFDLPDTLADTAIAWLGAHMTIPDDYTENDIYYNSSDSNTYICSNGKFQLLAFHDIDADYSNLEGLEVSWYGAREEPPSDPHLYSIYFESDIQNPFIWNGSKWAILHPYNQFPFNWRGVLMDAPENPVEKWAYFNVKHMMSYFYDGKEWKPFLRDYAID